MGGAGAALPGSLCPGASRIALVVVALPLALTLSLPQLHGYMENKPLGLQIFIGTADERILKPHAFYQVHRITGKTVTTTSYEKIVGNTKVLEIPLEPKSNMRAT